MNDRPTYRLTNRTHRPSDGQTGSSGSYTSNNRRNHTACQCLLFPKRWRRARADLFNCFCFKMRYIPKGQPCFFTDWHTDSLIKVTLGMSRHRNLLKYATHPWIHRTYWTLFFFFGWRRIWAIERDLAQPCIHMSLLHPHTDSTATTTSTTTPTTMRTLATALMITTLVIIKRLSIVMTWTLTWHYNKHDRFV